MDVRIQILIFALLSRKAVYVGVYDIVSRVVSRSQHRYIWYSTGGNYDVRINETGAWDEVPGLSLKFNLPEPASIRALYSMSVMPDQNFASDGEIYYIGKRL